MDTEEEQKSTQGLGSYSAEHGCLIYTQPLISPGPPVQPNSQANREQIHEGSQTASIYQVFTHASRVQRLRISLQAAGHGLAFVPCHNESKNSLQSQKPVEPHTQNHMQQTNRSIKGVQGQLGTLPERT